MIVSVLIWGGLRVVFSWAIDFFFQCFTMVGSGSYLQFQFPCVWMASFVEFLKREVKCVETVGYSVFCSPYSQVLQGTFS